jgi:lysophospholipase L1-like esterase
LNAKLVVGRRLHEYLGANACLLESLMSPQLLRMSWRRAGTTISLAASLSLAACGGSTPSSGPSDTDNTAGNASTDEGDDDNSDDSSGSTASTGVDAGKTTTPKLDSGTRDAGPPTKSVDPAGDASIVADAAKPSSGDAASGGGSDAGSNNDTSTELPADPGKGDGSDVITIGDSWMSNTLQIEGTGGGISASLIGAGNKYKNYAVQGVMLLTDSSFGPAIPTQWDAASKANSKIKTVLMTAGGNDIIQNSALSADCMAGGTMCDDELKMIGAELVTLWGKMAAAGVQDIIHIMYANDATGNTLKKSDDNAKGLAEICSKVMAPARCHLFATDDLIKASDIAIDGIHPLASANDRVAAALEKLMADQHIRR